MTVHAMPLLFELNTMRKYLWLSGAGSLKPILYDQTEYKTQKTKKDQGS